MKKKHRFPTYKLNEIKATLTSNMADGRFGSLPTSRGRGSNKFYERVQTWVATTYGHTIGQGTVYKCKQAAERIQMETFVRPVTTKSKSQPGDGYGLMLRRLSSAKVKESLSPKQQAYIASLKAWRKHTPLEPRQIESLKDMYKRYYKK